MTINSTSKISIIAWRSSWFLPSSYSMQKNLPLTTPLRPEVSLPNPSTAFVQFTRQSLGELILDGSIATVVLYLVDREDAHDSKTIDYLRHVDVVCLFELRAWLLGH